MFPTKLAVNSTGSHSFVLQNDLQQHAASVRIIMLIQKVANNPATPNGFPHELLGSQLFFTPCICTSKGTCYFGMATQSIEYSVYIYI